MRGILLAIVGIMVALVSCCYAEESNQMKSPRSRWSKQEAWDYYQKQPWLVGFNYVPSYACNTTEWWQEETFDPKTIDRELGWGSDIGYNTARVFIQYMVWKHDPDAFKNRFTQFLTIAANHGISVMPVLFDDCAFGAPPQLDPYLGKQRDLIPGMIGPSWTPSPGRTLGTDPGEKASLREYVVDMVSSFKEDKRIVLWDLYNEPMNIASVGTPEMIQQVVQWAREAGPTQPVTIAVWTNKNRSLNDLMIANSDVITFHVYTGFNGLKGRIAELKTYGYPIICSEWMARGMGSRFDTDLPLFKAEQVGCYQWGLVNGRTQCQFPWSNKPGGIVDPKTGWFHDILHSDGTPYRQEEVDVIRKVIGRKGNN